MKHIRNILITVLVLVILTAISGSVFAATVEKVPITKIRLAGSNRYETSYKIADDLYKTNGKFESVIVAYGMNFPDALAGGYLAKEKNAPILLSDSTNEGKALSYIRSHAKKGADVYILGGPGVVSTAFEGQLKAAGFKASRLGGANRFDTNLQILNAANAKGKEILVADGFGFADSLSGSAVGKPILIVDKNKGLTKDQKAWLKASGATKFYILGGPGSVSDKIANELRAYASVERIGGKNRNETSAMIAKKFFPKAGVVTLADSGNFPDGLSGAPVAMREGAPMLLVSAAGWQDAHAYVLGCRADKCYPIGGAGSLTEETVDKVMEQYKEHEHVWEEVKETVHHEATTKSVWVVDEEAWDEEVEEEVYVQIPKCKCRCGKLFANSQEWLSHTEEYDNNEFITHHSGWTRVYIDGTKTETKIVHHDEEGHYDYETVPAYDEEIVTGYRCKVCGEEKAK